MRRCGNPSHVFAYETRDGEYLKALERHLVAAAKEKGRLAGLVAGAGGLVPPHPGEACDAVLLEHPCYREAADPVVYALSVGKGSSYQFHLYPSREAAHAAIVARPPAESRMFDVVLDGSVSVYVDFEEVPLTKDDVLDSEAAFQRRCGAFPPFLLSVAESAFAVDLREVAEAPDAAWWLSSTYEWARKNSFHCHMPHFRLRSVHALAELMTLARVRLDELHSVEPDHPLCRALRKKFVSPEDRNPWIVDWTVYTPRRKFRCPYQSKAPKVIDGRERRAPLEPYDPALGRRLTPEEAGPRESWFVHTAINGEGGRPPLPSPTEAIRALSALSEADAEEEGSGDASAAIELVRRDLLRLHAVYYPGRGRMPDFAPVGMELLRLLTDLDERRDAPEPSREPASARAALACSWLLWNSARGSPPWERAFRNPQVMAAAALVLRTGARWWDTCEDGAAPAAPSSASPTYRLLHERAARASACLEMAADAGAYRSVAHLMRASAPRDYPTLGLPPGAVAELAFGAADEEEASPCPSEDESAPLDSDSNAPPSPRPEAGYAVSRGMGFSKAAKLKQAAQAWRRTAERWFQESETRDPSTLPCIAPPRVRERLPEVPIEEVKEAPAAAPVEFDWSVLLAGPVLPFAAPPELGALRKFFAPEADAKRQRMD